MKKKNYLIQNEWYRREYCNGDVLVQFLRPGLNTQAAFRDHKLVIYLSGERIFMHDDNLNKALNIMNKLEPDVWEIADFEKRKSSIVTNKKKTTLDFFDNRTIELIAGWMLSVSKKR